MTDMITLPEDPNAPPPVFPTSGAPRLRNANSAEWDLNNGLTIRYLDTANDASAVAPFTRQQLNGYNFLRHDPVPPAHLTQAARDQHAAYLESQADTFESMADAMEQARRNSHGGVKDGELGAALAELWARAMAALKRAKAQEIRNQTTN